MRKITTEIIKSFNDYMINEEKAAATVNKYLHDVLLFLSGTSLLFHVQF